MDFDPSTAQPVSGFDPSTATPVSAAPEAPKPTMPDRAALQTGKTGELGIAEGGLSLATGAVAAPIAGLSGLAAAAAKALGLTDTDPAELIRKVQEAITYQPRSEAGKTVASVASYPFEKLAQGADYVGGKTAEATGSPALGAAVNAGLQVGGPLALAKGAKAVVNSDAVAAAAEARAKIAALQKPVTDVIRAAREAGFKMSPSEINKNLGTAKVSSQLEGLSGSAKLRRGLAIENAEVVNDLIRKDTGLAADAPITVENLKNNIVESSAPYEAVKSLKELTVDNAYSAGELGPKITSTWRGARSMDPKTAYTMDAADAIEGLKQLRNDASAYYKQYARDASPETLKKAQTHLEAAKELEALIERNAEKAGQPELVTDLRAARTKIAKNFQAMRATNDATGNIDASVYARMLKDKSPLTGAASLVAKFAKTFPDLVQKVENIKHTGVDFGDMAIGGAKAAIAGTAEGLMTLGARPALRGALKSGPVQDLITQRPNYGPGTLESLMRMQASPAGAGVEVAGMAESPEQKRRRIEELKLKAFQARR